MVQINRFKEKSFLIYGLGASGQSVVKFFKKNNFKNFKIWDDNQKNIFKKYKIQNLKKILKDVNYIVLTHLE